MRYSSPWVSMWAILVIAVAILAMAVPAVAVSLQEEIDLGKKLDAEVLKHTPISGDEAAQKEIDRLGQTIVKKGGLNRPQIEYHFKVLHDDDMNAFSTCGGYVYFTDHLWNVLRTDERAGVLAHEIVHADRRHALDAMLKLQKRSTILGAILILAGANRTISNVVDMANQLSTLKYSRGDERQADEVGLQYLHNAGLNPVGLLLSMRKIDRFESEAGGRAPTILMNHPATPDRLQYISQDLTKMGLQVPPENIVTKNASDKIGAITSRSGDDIGFTSSKPLASGDVVWLMATAWDYYYEVRTLAPTARIVVTSAKDNSYAGKMSIVNPNNSKNIGKGTDVYAPANPPATTGVAVVTGDTRTAQSIGPQPVAGHTLTKMERLLSMAVVWNRRESKSSNEATGYVVITDPANRAGFVSIDRPEYGYAPLSAGAILVSLYDPDADRWIGPIISVGKSSRQVELLPNRRPSPTKTYDIAYPAWDKSEAYRQRVVAAAKLTRNDGKIVMSVTQFRPGWAMDGIVRGFDMYEQVAGK